MKPESVRTDMDKYENLSREQLIAKLGEQETRIAQLELSYAELIRKSQGYLEGYSHYLETLSRLPVGIFLTDQAGNYVYVNQTWCKLTGINYGGAMFANWMHAIAPHGSEIRSLMNGGMH
jgi:PAS domain-containing protein